MLATTIKSRSVKAVKKLPQEERYRRLKQRMC